MCGGVCLYSEHASVTKRGFDVLELFDPHLLSSQPLNRVPITRPRETSSNPKPRFNFRSRLDILDDVIKNLGSVR